MKMKRYVVKQQGNGDWISVNAASPIEAAKRAARCWELPEDALLLVAEGEYGFSNSELTVYTASGEKVDFTDFTAEVREDSSDSGERPCTCGSGIHWAWCPENSPYCG